MQKRTSAVIEIKKIHDEILRDIHECQTFFDLSDWVYIDIKSLEAKLTHVIKNPETNSFRSEILGAEYEIPYNNIFSRRACYFPPLSTFLLYYVKDKLAELDSEKASYRNLHQSYFKFLYSSKKSSNNFIVKIDIFQFYEMLDLADLVQTISDRLKPDDLLLSLLKKMLYFEFITNENKISVNSKGIPCNLRPFKYFADLYLNLILENYTLNSKIYIQSDDIFICSDSLVSARIIVSAIKEKLNKHFLNINQYKTNILQLNEFKLEYEIYCSNYLLSDGFGIIEIGSDVKEVITPFLKVSKNLKYIMGDTELNFNHSNLKIQSPVSFNDTFLGKGVLNPDFVINDYASSNFFVNYLFDIIGNPRKRNLYITVPNLEKLTTIIYKYLRGNAMAFKVFTILKTFALHASDGNIFNFMDNDYDAAAVEDYGDVYIGWLALTRLVAFLYNENVADYWKFYLLNILCKNSNDFQYKIPQIMSWYAQDELSPGQQSSGFAVNGNIAMIVRYLQEFGIHSSNLALKIVSKNILMNIENKE